MKFPQYRITDLLLLAVAVAMGWHMYNEFYGYYRDAFSESIVLGLLIVSSSVLAAKRISAHPFFWGFSSFLVLHILLVLRLGFTEGITNKCGLAMGYALMTGVAVRWALILFTDELRIDAKN